MIETGRLDAMFETRSHAWQAVGLAAEVERQEQRRAKTHALLFVPALAAVLLGYAFHHQLFGASADTSVRLAAALAIVVLGWGCARDVGRTVAPKLFRRLDPATAGTMGFVIRLGTIAGALLVALRIAEVSPATLLAGSAFTAVLVGLAAQQTLGNLFAGLVLVSAHPFRVGELIRLQAGPLAGEAEGVVSSLGLLYTTLARGEERIMIPNNAVLGAAVVPLKEPEPVDVRVRLGADMPPTHVQSILDARITTPMRDSAVLLEELDGDDVVIRVKAVPESALDGGRLADEVVEALTDRTS